MTLQTVAQQAPLPMAFSRTEYWSGLSCPHPGDLPNPGIKPASPVYSALAGRLFTTSTPGKPFAHADYLIKPDSVRFSSVDQSCPRLCNSMNRSTPGLPVHHQLQEFTQTHVHRVGDVIQPSHPLSSPLLLFPIPPSIRVFSSESILHMRWPKY